MPLSQHTSEGFTASETNNGDARLSVHPLDQLFTRVDIRARQIGVLINMN